MSTTTLRRVELAHDEDLPPALAADRRQAITDLECDNCFTPLRFTGQGPFGLRLGLSDGRLVFDISDVANQTIGRIGLALGPFRRLIKDYQLLVDSHLDAIADGREARIQAIDMGRRGLHDEGAALLRQRLADKIDIDHATARRLFTLLAVLHQKVPAR
jgi:uncharacterized protein (UPF0262 family)